MADITYRLLGPGDAGVLDSVNDDVFDDALVPELAREFLQGDANLLVVALDAGVVIGMASGLVHVHPDKPRQLFINEVGVAADYHRQGIARRLCRMLMEAGAAKGCVSAWVATEVDNAAARALYQSIGGTEDADQAVVYNFAVRRD